MRRTWIALAIVLPFAALTFERPPSFVGQRLVSWSAYAAPGHASKKRKPSPTRAKLTRQILFGDQRVERALDKRHAGVAQAFSFNARVAGVARSVKVYIASRDRATAFTVGLYSSKGSHPGSRIASGALRHPKAGAWNTVTVRATVIHPGGTYWLAVLGRGGTLYVRERAHGSCASELSFRRHLITLPRSWRTAPNRHNCPISAYVTGVVKGPVVSTAPSTAPVNVVAPQINGATLAGKALTASAGAWLNNPTSYSYQWKRCDAGGHDCSDISGATANVYDVTAADVNSTLVVVATARNRAGSGTASSIATGLVGAAGARIFYISYSTGNDSNNGTSKSASWQHVPGMNGCTANCAAYSHVAGDRFVFEGGDTWPNNSFPIATRSGTAASPDYYGVETDWHAGSSFSQPVFDAGGANMTGSDSNAPGGAQDIFMDLRRQDYITIDDIAFDNFTASGLTSAYGSCAAIEMAGDQNITINRISIPNMTAVDGLSCFGVQGATYAPYSGNSIVENSYISGSANSYAIAILCVGNVENNTVDHMIGEVYPCGHGTISGNLLENCGNPFPAGSSTIHADAIQSDAADGTFYIHDNVIHDTGSSASGECESMLIGNPGETDYVWDNVLYNINGNPISLTQNFSSPGVAAYIWNNSIEGGFAGTEYCVRAGHPATWTTIAIQNNFCVSKASAATDPGLSANSMAVDHNILLTPTQAASDGFGTTSTAFPYLPPPGSSPTAFAGLNFTSDCGGGLPGLCVDTSFGGARSQLGRPSSSAWDVGAYEVP